MSAILDIPEAAQTIVQAHGGGGEMTRRLIAEHILPRLSNAFLAPLTDGALIPAAGGQFAFTTDAFVVQPLEFPGGDIGRLAVCGTVNDLAVMGARPVALSLALIISEGFPLSALDRIVASIADTAREAGVPVATGDTKVIGPRGDVDASGLPDGLMITTSGIGQVCQKTQLGVSSITAGDRLLVNGGIAEHGLAVMSVREGLTFHTALRSDVAPLNGLIETLLREVPETRFLRDPTRGGLAGVVCDLAEETQLGIVLDEAAIPISRVALHTAEMLGLDPLSVANEGKVVMVVPPGCAERALRVCRAHPLGRDAAIIGEFVGDAPPLVELRTRSGGRRIVQRPYGEELPRIC